MMSNKHEDRQAPSREGRDPLPTDGSACGICGRADETLSFARDIERGHVRYNVRLCRRCGVGYTLPVPSSAVLSRLYALGSYRSDDGARFNGVLESFVRYFSAGKARKIGQFHKGRGSLLDVGCGRGLFLDIMRKDGWHVTGVEFNEETAACANKAYGVDVITPQALLALPDESFDVIMISHVLEHMYDPVESLRTSARLLKKHGLLFIAVPNLSSFQARLGKSRWFHLDVPCHLYHFTPAGLRRLLLDNSMEIARVQHFDLEQNIFGWLQTLLNMSGIKPNLLYALLKLPELRGTELATARRMDILLTLLLTPLYLPLSVVLCLIESMMRRGGTVQMYSLKQ